MFYQYFLNRILKIVLINKELFYFIFFNNRNLVAVVSYLNFELHTFGLFLIENSLLSSNQ